MKRIEINFESSPTRCEICHKADCFDPQTNQCSRCKDIEDENVVKELKKESLSYGNIGLICGALCGALTGLFWGKIRNFLLKEFFISISLSDSVFWVMVGFTLVGGIWGNLLGEGVRLLIKKGHNVNN